MIEISARNPCGGIVAYRKQVSDGSWATSRVCCKATATDYLGSVLPGAWPIFRSIESLNSRPALGPPATNR